MSPLQRVNHSINLLYPNTHSTKIVSSRDEYHVRGRIFGVPGTTPDKIVCVVRGRAEMLAPPRPEQVMNASGIVGA
ncbi:hypothetical protein JTE90_018448 [Oedothorax gibbosus]|uniref:Uncharacterized protein n=1 Tax=Oedothorax gibbosus TaxID=931172 RepID=A0AAV6UXX4_9ARAC|nr:hypothetical protein JTE90_018448 [Oedothorax gibbosus]